MKLGKIGSEVFDKPLGLDGPAPSSSSTAEAGFLPDKEVSLASTRDASSGGESSGSDSYELASLQDEEADSNSEADEAFPGNLPFASEEEPPFMDLDDKRIAIDAAKVDRWRQAKRLAGPKNDANFAFWFSSYEEAKTDAGRAVAQAWEKMRNHVRPQMALRAAAIVSEERRTSSPKRESSTPPAQPPKRRKLLALGPKKRPPRTEETRVEASHKQGFVSTLVDIQRTCSNRKDPALAKDSHKEAAFVSSITKRAERLCAQDGAEELTLKRVQDTWEDLIEHVKEVVGDMGHTAEDVAQYIRDMTVSELEKFVEESTAPSRVHPSLRWMFNNLDISLPIADMQAHRAKPADPYGIHAKQKPAVELYMIEQLEIKIKIKFHERAPDVLGDLSQWWQAVCGVRLKHLKLAFPCQLTDSLLKCFCIKGKQRGKRVGFRFAMPTFFITDKSYCWAARFMKLWHERTGGPSWKQVKLGMVFDLTTGEALTNQAAIEAARMSLSDWVGNINDMTSLSWRRAGTSLVQGAKFSAPEQLAFGDWQDRNAAGEEGKRLQQPVRYTDDKYLKSEKVKLSVYQIYTEIIKYKKWMQVPEEVWATMQTTTFHIQELQSLVDKNRTMRWQLPIELLPEVFQRRSFQPPGSDGEPLPTQMSDEECKPPMPDVKGKILLDCAVDQKPICPLYQTGSCRKENCPWIHMCAVALKSGRACGMFNHTAVDCFAKKMFIPPLEDQNETPAPDMPIEVLSSPNVTSEPPPPVASPEPCAARLRAISAF